MDSSGSKTTKKICNPTYLASYKVTVDSRKLSAVIARGYNFSHALVKRRSVRMNGMGVTHFYFMNQMSMVSFPST